MTGETIGFHVCGSDQEWLQALRVPRPSQLRRLSIPLPPECQPSDFIEGVLAALARRGGRTCPVDGVIGIGADSDTAARLFAWLTGSPILSTEAGICTPESIAGLCAGRAHVVFAFDKNFNGFGMADLSSALSMLDVNFGFIYSYDRASAVVGAIKTAFEIGPGSETGTCLIDTTTTLNVDQAFGGDHLTLGPEIQPERISEILSAPSSMKTIVSHGNGFDYNLGKTVLCCIDGSIPVIDDPQLFPCFQTGLCQRRDQVRLGITTLQSDFLLMATCWGVIDGANGLDYSRTAYARVLTSPGVWALLTSGGTWTASRSDWLRIRHVLGQSLMQGEVARRLNRLLDPLQSTFLLFGNPRSGLHIPPVDESPILSSKGAPAHRLEAGIHLVSIVSAEGGEYVAHVLKPDEDSPGGATDFASLPTGCNALTLVFNEKRLSIERVVPPRLGLEPGLTNYARLSRQFAAVEPVLPALNGRRKPSLARRLARLTGQSLAVGRVLEDRRAGRGHLLVAEELGGLSVLHGEWLQLSEAIVDAWLAWSTEGPAARHLVEIWRPAFKLHSAAQGPPCDVCHSRSRIERYACLARPLSDRLLTICRLCSTKSDLAEGLGLAVTPLDIRSEDGGFRIRVRLVNEAGRTALVCVGVYFMSRNEVWRECVSPSTAAWMNEGEAVTLDRATPRPSSLTPGSHWLVLIGLFDGEPFTHCTKVVIGKRPDYKKPLFCGS